MKEKLFLPALKERRENLDKSNDDLALRALTLKIFEASWKTTDLASFVADLRFPPISLANALIKLTILEIISLDQDKVTKAHDAERRILVARSKLIRVFGKSAWKVNDLREFERVRFLVEKN